MNAEMDISKNQWRSTGGGSDKRTIYSSCEWNKLIEGGLLKDKPAAIAYLIPIPSLWIAWYFV